MENRRAHATPLAALLAPTAPGPFFRRGFPWCISFTPSQFLAHAERLLPEVPAPTLSYSSRDDAADALFRSPLFARSPHLAGLLVLDLSYAQVGDEGVKASLESPLTDELVLLDLRGSPASNEMKDVRKARMGDRVCLVVGQAGGLPHEKRRRA